MEAKCIINPWQAQLNHTNAHLEKSTESKTQNIFILGTFLFVIIVFISKDISVDVIIIYFCSIPMLQHFVDCLQKSSCVGVLQCIYDIISISLSTSNIGVWPLEVD